ncbi:ABC transporter substrate-binding protein [Serratia microhaemolytica]|uniref:ABC transporter substrate-binding protein n=1 Tax=Serratia microhaemolytica TaxID=2675110 RepID=UPI000FDCF123|nr:ABC transporter substrate-binding protein [Serratia microhaemolytica]
MATTFSSEATAHIISHWQQQPQAKTIRTLNRTSASLQQLLGAGNGAGIDLILTSSPMLLHSLQQQQRLADYPEAPQQSQYWVPEPIRHTAVAIAISGFGLLLNRSQLQQQQLPLPTDWDSLSQAYYQGTLLMSSPSRSNTNHLMVESLLQQQGWLPGWQKLLSAAGNLITISSRSFGVADKIKNGLGSIGLTIDNYATPLLEQPHFSFHYFPDTPVSPTYIALMRASRHPAEARRFIQFLLSPQGQRLLADTHTGKYPVMPVAEGQPTAALQQVRLRQQMLLKQPQLNYSLLLQRQRLIQKLFDTAISFRLSQLQDAWRALHSAEQRLQRQLPQIRALLTAIPVTEAESEDPHYLQQFQLHHVTEQQVMLWQQFFQHQQREAIKQLEALR